jgi:hypothetical protein
MYEQTLSRGPYVKKNNHIKYNKKAPVIHTLTNISLIFHIHRMCTNSMEVVMAV